MTPDDIAIMHALSVAAMGRPWNETSTWASVTVVEAHLVDFSAIGTPFLTDDGVVVFRKAVVAMKEAK